jgi:hypothetical protein
LSSKAAAVVLEELLLLLLKDRFTTLTLHSGGFREDVHILDIIKDGRFEERLMILNRPSLFCLTLAMRIAMRIADG